MKLRLFNPFLLKRGIRALEKIASNLDDLVLIQMRINGFADRPTHPGDPQPPSVVDDDGGLSYSNDSETFRNEQIEERRRLP